MTGKHRSTCPVLARRLEGDHLPAVGGRPAQLVPALATQVNRQTVQNAVCVNLEFLEDVVSMQLSHNWAEMGGGAAHRSPCLAAHRSPCLAGGGRSPCLAAVCPANRSRGERGPETWTRAPGPMRARASGSIHLGTMHLRSTRCTGQVHGGCIRGPLAAAERQGQGETAADASRAQGSRLSKVRPPNSSFKRNKMKGNVRVARTIASLLPHESMHLHMCGGKHLTTILPHNPNAPPWGRLETATRGTAGCCDTVLVGARAFGLPRGWHAAAAVLPVRSRTSGLPSAFSGEGLLARLSLLRYFPRLFDHSPRLCNSSVSRPGPTFMLHFPDVLAFFLVLWGRNRKTCKPHTTSARSITPHVQIPHARSIVVWIQRRMARPTYTGASGAGTDPQSCGAGGVPEKLVCVCLGCLEGFLKENSTDEREVRATPLPFPRTRERVAARSPPPPPPRADRKNRTVGDSRAQCRQVQSLCGLGGLAGEVVSGALLAHARRVRLLQSNARKPVPHQDGGRSRSIP
eukprot:gene19441-biopygen10034